VLISNAFAQTPQPAAPQASAGLDSMLFVVPLILLFWFLMIRPQMKRAKEHKAMVEALSRGDEVIVGGGIAGKIDEIGENFVKVEIAANTVIAVQKQAIVTVLPKGTLKSL
jgi:preprotein translocase subunit YajC